MQSARDNVNARLGGEGEGQHGEDAVDRVDAQRPKITKANAPSAQQYDINRYNADGTLRKCFDLPDPDESWYQANNCYYVRKKGEKGKDKLDIDDIFSKQ